MTTLRPLAAVERVVRAVLPLRPMKCAAPASAVVILPPMVATQLVLCLETLGVDCRVSATAHDGAIALRQREVDLVFASRDLPRETLVPLAHEARRAAVVLVGSEGSRAGTDSDLDSVNDPLVPARVRSVVKTVLARRDLDRRLRDAEQRATTTMPALFWSARSAVMRTLLSDLEDVAERRHILLTGERGTGRGSLGRHACRSRLGHVVEVRCDKGSSDALTSSIFGDERRDGLIGVANRGTLLLREAELLPPAVQALLIQIVKENAYRRSNGETRPVDVRLVLTTTRVATDYSDLLSEMCGSSLRVPALHERPEDVVELARHFLAFYHPAGRFTAAALKTIEAYDWPGNVRELRCIVEESAHTARRAGSMHTELPFAHRRATLDRPRGPHVGGDYSLEDIERAHTEKVLSKHSLSDAAKILGVNDSTLWRMRKRYDLA